MAHLNKLAIRGIRSFDDKQIAVIEFFSPVTVIVGHNGSGKTTIIECLKYATTGDQPPNTRGGAFVHDPKMANEKEVKAQVKLRFHAANGKRMLAVRNLSVSVKKTAGLTMKTLESILALADGEEKGGKRGVISTKCAEMDSEIPQLLGVSKSVLENVIFCHQEDSYWPLAEPSILKKKFDDIFEATKYTKALDNIKALRKDRVAELKAEKERLEGLKREKGHADKLKERMEDLEKEIATKDADHTRLNHEHETIMMKNKSFFEKGTQFRDIFTKVDALEQQLEKAQADFHETKDSIQILPDTENELKLRISTFESNINKKKMERKERDAELNQAERDQIKAQGEHTELVTRKGSLQAQADAQAQRINEREQLIREIAVKYGIKLKDAGGGPMERSQIVEFSQNLEAATRKAKEDHTGLMTKLRAVTNDYNDKLAGLERTLQAYISQKQIHRESMSTNTSKIATLQRMLDDQDSLALQLETLNGDLEDKQAKVNKLREEIKKAKYEDRIIEKSQAIRSLNDQKDALNAEFASLSSQANVRAKLDLKRQEVKSKGSEIKSLVDASSSRFKKLVGSNIKPETMERDLDQLQRIKEQEREELEDVQKDSGRALQLVESSLINARSRLKSRQGELQSLQSKIKKALSEDPNFEGFDNVQAAIEDADKQIGNIRTSLGELKGSGEIFVRMLAEGQKSHSCPTCTQSLKQKAAMDAFVKKMQDEQRKRSKERIAEEEDDLRGWAEGLDILQALVPDENAAKRIKENDVPTLEREIKEQEKQMPQLNDAAEKASESLAAIVKDLKDIAALKTQASSITRLHREVAAAQSEISSLETQLAATGSTKTADDVQNEIDNLGTQIRAAEREKTAIERERDSKQSALRSHENEVNTLNIQVMQKEHELENKIKNEQQLKELQDSNAKLATQVKDADSKIKEAQEPVNELKAKHQEEQRALDESIAAASTIVSQLNQAGDQLSNLSRTLERYVKEKRAAQLQDCIAQIAAAEQTVAGTAQAINNLQTEIAKIDREINLGGSTLANLRDNIRFQKLAETVRTLKEEISTYDLDEAAEARRNFEQEYTKLKAKEDALQKDAAYLLGVLNADRNQLTMAQKDLREFKDIYKKYTDQLVKVKMSDMANNDLEKYAKALDNAIMKYHALKMEEVNDTMKHLWNKTYQGTDIDGIKIRSDSEGGTTKRSYNYRVVMTKDQVEMDMRGRCSAGQKMLASIIIRLALSDSFGQNCGILALDEPTNALDTENIDALASSLVDIINERKGHSNFQLIIITHDENFLRKLGQNDVMEHYWRVSRDARQKSVIERQRFR